MCLAGAEGWKCSTCLKENEPTVDFCDQCGLPSDLPLPPEVAFGLERNKELRRK